MAQKHKHILDRVTTIVKHHKELTIAKGELFNIYSILNLKTKEVRTHSAFIAELLNPSGSHFMGSKFLKAFLEVLPSEDFDKHLDLENTIVFIEFYIGAINRESKTGGRIDLLLKDNQGKSIAIENKIDADDQGEQIERYCNYNKNNNKVIYLSKFGDEPSEMSKGELSSGSDFYVISYKNEIINWLEICQNIASDQPILRESIKQYKILIQQITNTLGNQQENELEAVVVNSLEEASQISSKYIQVVKTLKENFRKAVLHLLEESEMEGYTYKTQKEVSSACASVWFHNKVSDAKKTWFGVESFSGIGHSGGVLFVGIYSEKRDLELDKEYDSLNKGWIHHKILKFDNQEVNLSDNSFLQRITTKENLNIVAKDIVKQIIPFVKEHAHLV